MDEIWINGFLNSLDPTAVTRPARNYVKLMKEGREPYSLLAKYALLEMANLLRTPGSTEVVYTINPRILRDQAEQEFIKLYGNDWYFKKEFSEIRKKLTAVTASRCISAIILGKNLEEEKQWYTTTTTGGRVNYHVKPHYLFSPRPF